jgi:acyl carrier protein
VTTRASVAATVRNAIAEVVAVEPGEVEETTDLEADFRIDSLELMEIGTKLERALGIRLSIDDLVSMRTVGQAIDLLCAELQVPA